MLQSFFPPPVSTEGSGHLLEHAENECNGMPEKYLLLYSKFLETKRPVT